jgi:hypothetical protein
MTSGLDWDAMADGILEAIGRRVRNDTGDLSPPPDRAVVARLLEAAFWATLATDEGRATKFRIALVRREAPMSTWPVLWFDAAERVSVRGIRKLAQAHDPRHGVLVATGATGDDVALVGLLHDPRRTSYPAALMVEGRGPGQLHVYWQAERILEVAEGGAVSPTEFPFDSARAADAIARSLSWVRGPGGAREVLLFGYFVITVAFAIEKLGQGGAIWLMPREHPQTDAVRRQGRAVQANPSFWDPHRAVLEDRIFRMRVGVDEPGDRVVVDQALQDHRRLSSEGLVQAIARLSGVDGAILMRAPPELLAFGVIAHDLRIPARIVRLGHHDSRHVEDVGPGAFGGSRHGSAMGFVNTYGGAAIVTSHDGGVTLFQRDERGAVCGARVSRLDVRRDA